MNPRGTLLIIVCIASSIHHSLQCPDQPRKDWHETEKALYKSGEILDMSPIPITLEKIKQKLNDTGIFDASDPSLSERERKELNKLLEAVEIMMTSRNRQPSTVQNAFSSLRVVERAVKKQLKEGQISEALASRFNWDKLSARQKRDRRTYYLDAVTNMRVFNTANN